MPDGFDPEHRYCLHPKVALRPEPFGALAYHYGNRRLTFLRSPELVALLGVLHEHRSVMAALEVSAIPKARWPTLTAALATLASSEVICAR
jgi:putative mycofactocin binding protein MftB